MFFVFGFTTAKLVADSLVLGVAAGMAWTWHNVAIQAIKRGARTGTDKIILTVWLAWFMLLVQRAYVIFAAMIDRPEWLVAGFVPILIAMMIFLAGFFGLSAPATGTEELPKRQQLHLIVGWFIAGAVGGGAIVYFLLSGPV